MKKVVLITLLAINTTIDWTHQVEGMDPPRKETMDRNAEIRVTP